MTGRISDIAFTASVKARQAREGSRDMLEQQLARRDWQSEIDADLAAFIATRESFYMATVSEEGRPYIQHRGGPPGFLKVLDSSTLAFADFSGNRQYISAGHLDVNPNIHLFLMDHANRQRIKIWGTAKTERDAGLIERLMPEGYRARAERAIRIKVEAWDVNCQQHIPLLYPEEVVRQVSRKLHVRIAELEAENAELRRWLKRE